MITQRGKILLGLLAVFLFICAYALLAYNQYIQQKQINSLVQPKTIKEIVVVTPTSIPTATPEAKFKVTTSKPTVATRISTPASATRGDR